MAKTFEVGITYDFLAADGTLPYKEMGLELFQGNPAIRHQFMAPHPMVFAPDHIRPYDAIVSMAPKYTKDTFRGAERLVVIARFGVGYDVVDVAACTEADVALTTARGAVDHSMAESIVTWMMALSYRIFEKDSLQRRGEWGDKLRYLGRELRDHRLGIVGLGGIGRKLVQKVSGLGMKTPMTFDPFLTAAAAKEAGVESVPLDPLLKTADFVCICCPLTPETRGLIGRAQFALMKPEAYFINAARGPIVDEGALVETLRARRIAGAAIDVFAEEPAGKDHPLNGLDNVILAPHCIGYTHEMFRDIGRLACASVLEASHGQVPRNVINTEVLQRPGFRKKLEAWSR